MVFFVLEYIRPEPFVQLKIQMASLVVFPILWLALPPRRRPWSRNLTLQTAFVGVCAMSALFASNTFAAYTATRIMYGYLVIALAATWLLANRRDFVFAIWFWVLIMAFQALYGVTHGGHGNGSTFDDENDLALGLNTALPFALVGIREFSGWKRWGSLTLTVLILAGIVVSLSRGGFIGLVSVTIYFVLVSRNRVRNLLITAVGALIFFFAIPTSYKSEVASIQDTDTGTAETRFFLWTAAFNMWRDNPVLGVGAGNSNWSVGRYQPEGRASGMFSAPEFHDRDWTMRAVHSVFFQVLSETGIVGSTLFIAMVVGHYRGLNSLRRRVRRHPGAPRGLRKETEFYATAMGAAMTGYLASGAFLSVLYYPYPWYFSAFAVAWTSAVGAQLKLATPGQSVGTQR